MIVQRATVSLSAFQSFAIFSVLSNPLVSLASYVERCITLVLLGLLAMSTVTRPHLLWLSLGLLVACNLGIYLAFKRSAGRLRDSR